MAAVHPSGVEHDGEESPSFEFFGNTHDRFWTVHSECERHHNGPLNHAPPHGRHVMRLPVRVGIVRNDLMFFMLFKQGLECRGPCRIHGENNRHEIFVTARDPTGVHGLLDLLSVENFLNKFFSKRFLKHIHEAEEHLLCVVLICTGKTRKTCCERTMKGSGVGHTIRRPYLLDELRELACDFARPNIRATQEGIRNQGHVCETLHSGVEVARVPEIRKAPHPS